MAKYRVTYEGVGLSQKELHVFFRVGEGVAGRMAMVKVPREVFSTPEAIHWVNEAVNRRLKAAWEEDEPFIRAWE
uniref:Uncharacterized protein n=1 Tax=uncultured prokaryote TaxID=198431 RepID=A0A0H5Q5W9_9ZZZZ|nr:hypothetical protein [uncultured prokaryote]